MTAGCSASVSSTPSIKASKTIDKLKKSDSFYFVEMYVVKLQDGTYALASTSDTAAGMWYESEDKIFMDGKVVRVAKNRGQLARIELTGETEKYLFKALKGKNQAEQQEILRQLYESGDKKLGSKSVSIPSAIAGPDFKEESVPNNGVIESLEAFLVVNGGKFSSYPYCFVDFISSSANPKAKYFVVAYKHPQLGDLVALVRSDNGSLPIDKEKGLASLPILMEASGVITSFAVSDYVELDSEFVSYLRRMEENGLKRLITEGKVSTGQYINAITDSLLLRGTKIPGIEQEFFDALSFGLSGSDKLKLSFHMRLFPDIFVMLSSIMSIYQSFVYGLLEQGTVLEEQTTALKEMASDLADSAQERAGVSKQDFENLLNVFHGLALSKDGSTTRTQAIKLNDLVQKLNKTFFIPRGFELELYITGEVIPSILTYRIENYFNFRFQGKKSLVVDTRVRSRLDKSSVTGIVGLVGKTGSTWDVVVDRSACNGTFIELGTALAKYRSNIIPFIPDIPPLSVVKILFTRQDKGESENILTSMEGFYENYSL